MKTVHLKVFDEGAGRPTGNPFNVKPRKMTLLSPGACIYVIEVGLGISVCDDAEEHLRVVSMDDRVTILNHYFGTSMELCIVAHINGPLPDRDESFAQVTVFGIVPTRLRFVEIKDGKRVIVGGPEEASNG